MNVGDRQANVNGLSILIIKWRSDTDSGECIKSRQKFTNSFNHFSVYYLEDTECTLLLCYLTDVGNNLYAFTIYSREHCTYPLLDVFVSTSPLLHIAYFSGLSCNSDLEQTTKQMSK